VHTSILKHIQESDKNGKESIRGTQTTTRVVKKSDQDKETLTQTDAEPSKTLKKTEVYIFLKMAFRIL
jgi:hypothetical protein